MNKLELTTRIDADAEAIFAAVLDIQGQSAHMDHLHDVEILSTTPETMLVKMHETVDGADVYVTSRFRFEAPRWVTYEHVESPFGVNQGRFEITQHKSYCELSQTHATEQDLDAKPTLRDDWTSMMRHIHATIARLATSDRDQT